MRFRTRFTKRNCQVPCRRIATRATAALTAMCELAGADLFRKSRALAQYLPRIAMKAGSAAFMAFRELADNVMVTKNSLPSLSLSVVTACNS